MDVAASETRRLSASLFGNEKVVEVVLALHAVSAPATAQEMSRATGISHSMVRDVLLRLVTSNLATTLPKVGGSRASQYYEATSGPGWERLVALAAWVAGEARRLATRADAGSVGVRRRPSSA